MKILIIKTSSLGDVIHALPAIVDAKRALPELQIDWMVEERFRPIIELHPLIHRVIPMAWRRWRKKIFCSLFSKEFSNFITALRKEKYDAVIDLQGLMKSASCARVARGTRCGYDRRSIREPLASFFYNRRFSVARNQHAVNRNRQLLAQSLNYTIASDLPDYGFQREALLAGNNEPAYIAFIHGTNWTTKQWPEQYWRSLTKLMLAAGYQVKIIWGSPEEHERSKRIANDLAGVEVIPFLDSVGVAKILAHAKGAVSVDTGFAHLTEALNVPMISLYGATSTALTGPLGEKQKALVSDLPCAPCLSRECKIANTSTMFPPCFEAIDANTVYHALLNLIER